MSEYRRFIAYMYEYNGNEKMQNAGFVRVHIRNGVCRMQVKIQMDKRENGEYRMYGYVHEGTWLYGIELGRISIKKGLGEGRLAVPESVFRESGYSFARMSGLWIRKGDEAENAGEPYFVSMWDETPVKEEQFVTVLPVREEEERVGRNNAEECDIEEAISEEKKEKSRQELEAQNVQEAESGKKCRAEEPCTEERRSEEYRDKERIAECETERCGTLMNRWEQFQYHYPHVAPFVDSEITECIEIAPKDLTFLGKTEQTWQRSPFVQQKYMKYHHLLLGKHQNGQYLLAVPGVNQSVQDKNLAAMYGFPEYKEVKEGFGYWYHFL